MTDEYNKWYGSPQQVHSIWFEEKSRWSVSAYGQFYPEAYRKSYKEGYDVGWDEIAANWNDDFYRSINNTKKTQDLLARQTAAINGNNREIQRLTAASEELRNKIESLKAKLAWKETKEGMKDISDTLFTGEVFRTVLERMNSLSVRTEVVKEKFHRDKTFQSFDDKLLKNKAPASWHFIMQTLEQYKDEMESQEACTVS